MECETPAIFRYTWPGKEEDYACAFHADRLMKIARSCKFHIQMILIDPNINHRCGGDTYKSKSRKRKVSFKNR